MHAALAASAGAVGDLDRRAWHLAAAAVGPDEAVAGELERASQREQARAWWAAASTLLARAAALSAGPPARARRLLGAAEASCMAWRPRTRPGAARRSRRLPRDCLHIGLAQRVQARVDPLLHDPAAATSALLAAAVELGPVDIRWRDEIPVEAVVHAQISGRFAPAGTARADVARVAYSMPRPPGCRGHGR